MRIVSKNNTTVLMYEYIKNLNDEIQLLPYKHVKIGNKETTKDNYAKAMKGKISFIY